MFVIVLSNKHEALPFILFQGYVTFARLRILILKPGNMCMFPGYEPTTGTVAISPRIGTLNPYDYINDIRRPASSYLSSPSASLGGTNIIYRFIKPSILIFYGTQYLRVIFYHG